MNCIYTSRPDRICSESLPRNRPHSNNAGSKRAEGLHVHEHRARTHCANVRSQDDIEVPVVGEESRSAAKRMLAMIVLPLVRATSRGVLPRESRLSGRAPLWTRASTTASIPKAAARWSIDVWLGVGCRSRQAIGALRLAADAHRASRYLRHATQKRRLTCAREERLWSIALSPTRGDCVATTSVLEGE